MNKKLKLYIVSIISVAMLVSWALIFFVGTKDKYISLVHSQGIYINYWWQIFMGISALLFGIFGVTTASKWNWLKSGVGRGIFFISLGLFVWGIGQFGWSYYLFKDPNVQSPPSHLLDIIDISVIPLWFYGMIELTRATGARYGLKKTSGKILIVLVSLIMVILSYYLLVDVARGGASYFDQPFWKQFFDLGYSIGDAILITFSIVVFGLSWKYLGGRLRLPIIFILISFVMLFSADTSFSYLDGKNLYFNGDVADLLFFLMLATMGLGVTMLDPDHIRAKGVAQPVAVAAPEENTSASEASQALQQLAQAGVQKSATDENSATIPAQPLDQTAVPTTNQKEVNTNSQETQP